MHPKWPLQRHGSLTHTHQLVTTDSAPAIPCPAAADAVPSGSGFLKTMAGYDASAHLPCLPWWRLMRMNPCNRAYKQNRSSLSCTAQHWQTDHDPTVTKLLCRHMNSSIKSAESALPLTCYPSSPHLLSPCRAPAVLEDPEIYASLRPVSNNDDAMIQCNLLFLFTARGIKNTTCSR
jgi:hypothetical protein